MVGMIAFKKKKQKKLSVKRCCGADEKRARTNFLVCR